jgi:hypothetical protein
MQHKANADKFSEKEAQERFEAALKSALKTSPKPLKDKPKVGKPTKEAKKKPASEPSFVVSYAITGSPSSALTAAAG